MSNLPDWMENKKYTFLRKTKSVKPLSAPLEERAKKKKGRTWDEQRRKCYKKYKHICQLCGCKTGAGNKTVAHHKSYLYKKGSKKEFKVLIALCEKCHNNFHKKHCYSRKKGWHISKKTKAVAKYKKIT